MGLGFNEEDWGYIYVNPYKLTKNTRILQFHYRVTHRILACKEKLFKWKIKESIICDRCSAYADGIEHHLIACLNTQLFWDRLFNWWRSCMKIMFPIDTYDILFGLNNPNDDVIINQINFTTLHAMYYIYNCNRKQDIPELYHFLMELKGKMVTECKVKQFDKAWAELYDSF